VYVQGFVTLFVFSKYSYNYLVRSKIRFGSSNNFLALCHLQKATPTRNKNRADQNGVSGIGTIVQSYSSRRTTIPGTICTCCSPTGTTAHFYTRFYLYILLFSGSTARVEYVTLLELSTEYNRTGSFSTEHYSTTGTVQEDCTTLDSYCTLVHVHCSTFYIVPDTEEIDSCFAQAGKSVIQPLPLVLQEMSKYRSTMYYR
jgi:hypothetical protein